MVYVDENGRALESVDLSRGYLVDEAWEEQPEIPEQGHYEYDQLQGGGRLQRYVVEVPYRPACREVTVQRYVPYTAEELAAMAKQDYAARLEALEAQGEEIAMLRENSEMLTNCVLEMSELVYA